MTGPTRWPPASGASWVVDLDGVVWLAGEPIPGTGAAVARLRDAGSRVLFATNNSAPTMGQLLALLSRAGIAATPEDVVTSGQAAAGLVTVGMRVLVVGGGGLHDAVAGSGAQVVDAPPADVVMVGWSASFDVAELTAAMRAVRGGARLIGTNEDPTYPTPDGLLPGSGAFLAAVATASGREPEIAGKPHPPMVSLIRERVQAPAVVVGDRPSTDGLLAEGLGAAYALVDSGVTPSSERSPQPAPAARAADLGALVAGALGP